MQHLREQTNLVKKKNKRKNNDDLIKQKLINSILSLLKNKTFSKITMKEIYFSAKIHPPEAYKVVKNKKDILILINNYFNEEVYKKTYNIKGSNVNDRIFEILMTRFEVLNIHRVAVIKIFDYLIKKPDMFIFFAPLMIDSLKNILELSESKSDGFFGKMKVEGFLIVYISIFLVWKKDKTKNLEKTMVAIDNHLKKAEVFLNLINNKNG